jgi:hypothetical protein
MLPEAYFVELPSPSQELTAAHSSWLMYHTTSRSRRSSSREKPTEEDTMRT